MAPIAEAESVFDIETNLSLWWVLLEENQNGIEQAGSGDPAEEAASGFAIKQGRIILSYEDTDNHFGLYAQVRLEERVAILDLYGMWKPVNWFNFYAGQMKIPSTYEVLTKDECLDFVTRTTISKYIADYSLSRTPYLSSFWGNRSYYRDTGIAFKGAVGPESNRQLLQYFLMISNGLGAGVYIGGPESKENVTSNKFGDYFYGLRMDVNPIKWVTIGGHYSINKHDDMLLGDGKTVLDLDRSSWSADLRFEIPYLRVVGMYGAGEIDEKYYMISTDHFDYSGWEAKALAQVWKDHMEVGVRYDNYIFGETATEHEIEQNNWTFGVNYTPAPAIRLQLNYMVKDTDNGIDSDVDDDLLVLNFQFIFGAQKSK